MMIGNIYFNGVNMNYKWDLWPHQERAVKGINDAWISGRKSVCCQLPTGSGKTRVIRTIVDQQADKSKVIYILAHREKLVDQLSEELQEAGIRHGIIKSGSPYIRYRVQVASRDTLVRRLEKLPEPSVIIIDESHHIKANSYLKIIEKWQNAKVLGMTATPERQDGKGLDDVFDTLILGPSMKSLIEKGKLSNYDYYAPPSIDMSGVHSRMGDYIQKESLEKVDKSVITGDVIEHYKKYADHKPTICCCINIEHSLHVAKQFREAGYKSVAVNSKMSKRDIKAAISGLADGTLEILTQCDMLGEGVDIPGVECLIQLRPTQSLVIFMQQCGRVLRIAKGKDKAIILDHVGNYERFGLPDDPRAWTLQGKKGKDKGKIEYKHCPECLMVNPISARECSNCGYLWKQTREAGKRQIEEKEGKLISIKSANKDDVDELQKLLARAHNLKECIKIAKQNGYDHKGAFYIWTEVFNNNPKDIVRF